MSSQNARGPRRDTGADLTRQKAFFANLSHEFRTPLAAIRCCAETLLRGGLSDKTSAPGFVETIERNAVRLGELVENLLCLSVQESGGLPPAPRAVDLSALTRDLLKDLRPLARHRRVQFENALPRGLKGVADPLQARLILLNLLSNAIKYNRRGGLVTVEGARDGRAVSVSVSDTGIGIPPRELNRVFERFYRSTGARRRGVTGTGLGLALAKEMAEGNGGRIKVLSTRGVGTTFTLELRIRP